MPLTFRMGRRCSFGLGTSIQNFGYLPKASATAALEGIIRPCLAQKILPVTQDPRNPRTKWVQKIVLILPEMVKPSRKSSIHSKELQQAVSKRLGVEISIQELFLAVTAAGKNTRLIQDQFRIQGHL